MDFEEMSTDEMEQSVPHSVANATSSEPVDPLRDEGDDKSEQPQTTRLGRPMRRSALAVAKRVADIAEWENAGENSSIFVAAAKAMEKEFAQEKRRRVQSVAQGTMDESEVESCASCEDEDDTSEILTDYESESDHEFLPQRDEPVTQSQSSSSACSDDEESSTADECDSASCDDEGCASTDEVDCEGDKDDEGECETSPDRVDDLEGTVVASPGGREVLTQKGATEAGESGTSVVQDDGCAVVEYW